ncbi:MAG TPA: indolepyruvate ferredoxin oxidoreductase subunit beta [Thermoprotei archaeon]|nr:indolepyruvate ferredoxin oxidoreductase subunit beta [Thermoprotei archaeon]
MEVYNVVLAGVGGQGIITVGKIIVDAALREGKNAVMSEVHGMAQRGGSVLSEVRIGDAMSSIIPSGEADLVIGFELIEPLRYVEKFGERTILLVNNDRIMPLPTLLGEEEYPSSEVIVSEMKKLTKRLYVINASKLAEEAGSPLSMNMVMLGAALSLGMPLKPGTVKEVLRERFRGKVLEINEKALDLGFSTVEKMLKSVD